MTNLTRAILAILIILKSYTLESFSFKISYLPSRLFHLFGIILPFTLMSTSYPTVNCCNFLLSLKQSKVLELFKTCCHQLKLPFGTRDGSQIFQRLSDGVRYIMRQKGFTIIDYIHDYVGMGVPSIASASYVVLIDLMTCLGLTISQCKLVPPATQVTCLGILIDTVRGTIAIPPEKLCDVTTMHLWLSKDVVSKRELQSILGLLLYVINASNLLVFS